MIFSVKPLQELTNLEARIAVNFLEIVESVCLVGSLAIFHGT